MASPGPCTEVADLFIVSSANHHGTAWTLQHENETLYVYARQKAGYSIAAEPLSEDRVEELLCYESVLQAVFAVSLEAQRRHAWALALRLEQIG